MNSIAEMQAAGLPLGGMIHDSALSVRLSTCDEVGKKIKEALFQKGSYAFQTSMRHGEILKLLGVLEKEFEGKDIKNGKIIFSKKVNGFLIVIEIPFLNLGNISRSAEQKIIICVKNEKLSVNENSVIQNVSTHIRNFLSDVFPFNLLTKK